MSDGLRFDFWALDDDHTYLAPLPKALDWTVSLIAGKPGGLEFKYPLSAVGADVLEERVTRRHDLPVAIRWDGTAATALLGRLYARDGSDVDESGLITYTGALANARFEEYELGPGAGENGAHVFAAATAGRILREVLELAQADGALLDLTWSFTDTHDSNGVAWTQQTNAEIGPKTSVLDVVDQLRAWGMAECEINSQLEVRASEPETVGTDHTLADPPLVLRGGRDVVDATRRSDSRGAATKLLVEGADGIYVEVDDPTAEAIRGRRIVRSVSQGQLTTTGAATAYGQLELARTAYGVQEVQIALSMHPDHPLPLRDLWPGDWVWRDTTRQLVRERIVQLTISQRGGHDHPEGSVVLGDLIASHAEALQRQIDGLIGGQVIAGTSTAGPDVDDGLAPAAPDAVLVDSVPYGDQDGTWAAVTADWPPVTENSDGSMINDLRGYLVRWRYDEPSLPDAWTYLPITAETAASWDAVVAGAVIDVEVAAQDKWDHTSAWMAAAPHTTQADATPPPVPSAPSVSSYLGLLAVEWDGLGSAGEAMPADFSHVEIHVSPSAGFTPSPATYMDRLHGAGIFPAQPTGATYGATYYVRLISVDKTGNASAASAQGSAVLAQVGDGDIAAVSIGKLTAGMMSALMTISGIIRTAASGARVELDTAGLRCYSSTGALLFSFSISTSVLEIIGKLTAGAGVGSGATVVIDPSSPPRIDLYPTSSAQRTRLLARTTDRPSGGAAAGFELQTLNAAGQLDGFHIDAWSTNVWIGHRITSGAWQGAIVKLERAGSAVLGTDNGFVQVTGAGDIYLDAGGDVAVDADGDIYFAVGSGREVNANVPFGSRANGLSFWCQDGGTYPSQGVRMYASDGTIYFVDNASGDWVYDAPGVRKTFVISHPTDPDRWLVHNCVEMPEALVAYRGVATLHDGQAEVQLPTYFDAATVPGTGQVQATAVLSDGECPSVHPVAASTPRDGRFRIVSPGPDGTQVAWHVTAQRADVDEFEVEPLRADYVEHGDGPYRYLTRRNR